MFDFEKGARNLLIFISMPVFFFFLKKNCPFVKLFINVQRTKTLISFEQKKIPQ